MRRRRSGDRSSPVLLSSHQKHTGVTMSGLLPTETAHLVGDRSALFPRRSRRDRIGDQGLARPYAARCRANGTSAADRAGGRFHAELSSRASPSMTVAFPQRSRGYARARDCCRPCGSRLSKRPAVWTPTAAWRGGATLSLNAPLTRGSDGCRLSSNWAVWVLSAGSTAKAVAEAPQAKV
jgi:hypothetical protein